MLARLPFALRSRPPLAASRGLCSDIDAVLTREASPLVLFSYKHPTQACGDDHADPRALHRRHVELRIFDCLAHREQPELVDALQPPLLGIAESQPWLKALHLTGAGDGNAMCIEGPNRIEASAASEQRFPKCTRAVADGRQRTAPGDARAPRLSLCCIEVPAGLVR